MSMTAEQCADVASDDIIERSMAQSRNAVPEYGERVAQSVKRHRT
jgi:hypothetical protein